MVASTALKPKPRKAKKKGHRRDAKPIEDHILEGTYRKHRHGPAPTPLTLHKPVVTRLPTKKDTKKWIRSEADERAVANGCRFSEELAAYFVEWIVKYCRHSEGFWAGKPFEPMDWQRNELFYPLFGWVKKGAKPFDGLIVRRFRRVYVEIPKKNGKSPTGAVIGTYMMAGDGEVGAKVFSIATDKKQAGICHTHAIHMVEDSPELSALCKINHTTQLIVFNPTRSKYSVVAKVPGGAEGLNGNCAILDEVHAWYGDKLFRAVKYMGRSRPSPIIFQITTAGDDMQSVCRQQHDYGRGVLSGDIHDDGFLPVIYAADRDDDWTDEKTWEKANPSLDHLISRDTLREDCNEAQNSPRLISTFKRYGLNIWGTAENPWLRMDKWARCAAKFTEEDLAGQPCWAGLDLSKCLDMTALALVFRDPDLSDLYRQLVYYWLPEDTVRERAHLASYREWERLGFLEVTPGDSCDYAFVRKRIVAIKEMFDLQELVYDPQYAEYFTDELEKDYGIARVEFRQGMLSYAEPTSEYERLVTSGKLLHNDNPITNWQAGHVMVKTDENKNIRPVKQKHGDYRTIDGIVGGVMALSRVLAGGPQASRYETEEPIVL